MSVTDLDEVGAAEPGARKQKILAGLIFIGVGVVALVQLRGITFGSALQPGPGFFPVLLAASLAVLGLVNIVAGYMEAAATPLFGRGRAVVLIPLAVVAFGVVVDRYGLIPAILLSTALCGLAARRFRPVETLIVCVMLSIFGAGVFIYALGLPFTLVQD